MTPAQIRALYVAAIGEANVVKLGPLLPVATEEQWAVTSRNRTATEDNLTYRLQTRYVTAWAGP